jgi:hypothetical protein
MEQARLEEKQANRDNSWWFFFSILFYYCKSMSSNKSNGNEKIED